MRAGPRNKPTQREREEHEATHVPLRLVRTLHDGKGRTHHHVAKQKSEGSVKKAHRRHDLLSHENGIGLECPSNLRRIDNLRCGEGRQTSKHHEQCGNKEGSRRVDSRESGEIHWLAWLPRDHVKERLKACSSRIQKSYCCNVQSGSYHEGRSGRRQRVKWTHPNNQVSH